MRLGQAIRVGAWFLVGLNLLMALGSIGIFTRMAPAITVIIDRNERSLQACEDMLASLVLSEDVTRAREQEILFRSALERSKNNVTEKEEPDVLKTIEARYPASFRADQQAREATVNAITKLGKINREAMIKADGRARQLGYAGAWGVVFMAVSVYVVGIIFIRSLTRRVVRPLEEIHSVITAHRNGETMRRCFGTDLPRDIWAIYQGINEILDKSKAADLTSSRVLSGNNISQGNLNKKQL